LREGLRFAKRIYVGRWNTLTQGSRGLEYYLEKTHCSREEKDISLKEENNVSKCDATEGNLGGVPSVKRHNPRGRRSKGTFTGRERGLGRDDLVLRYVADVEGRRKIRRRKIRGRIFPISADGNSDSSSGGGGILASNGRVPKKLM